MNSNGLITAPVNAKADVARVLTTSNTNLSNLCTHPNINMWSKKKPISFNKTTGLTDLDRKDAAYGLYFDPEASLNITWEYKPPTGGSSSPYRLGDFDGYDHNMKSGLLFTLDSYEKDITKDYNGIRVELYTDPDMITLKDFNDTLLKGCKIRVRLRSYDSLNQYSYTTEYEDAETSSLSWDIPREALIGVNVGRAALEVELLKPNGTIGNPLIKDITFVNVVADTGVEVTSWGWDMTVGTSTSNMHPASEYQPGVSKYTLDVSNGEDIYFNLGGLRNNSGQTITSSNVYLLMSYLDDGVSTSKRIPLYKGSNLDTYLIPDGETIADYFGVRHSNIPSLPSSTTVVYSILVNITFNGINGNYTITDIPIRMLTKN